MPFRKNTWNVWVNTVVYLDPQWKHKQQREDKFVGRCDMNPQKKENNVWFLNSGVANCIPGKFVMPYINGF